MTHAEITDGMTRLLHHLAHVLPAELAERAQVNELEDLDNTDTMIEIAAQQRHLADETEPLPRAITLAIGKSRSITGVATFDNADANRRFNAEKFHAAHPDVAKEFRKTAIDGTAVKSSTPACTSPSWRPHENASSS